MIANLVTRLGAVIVLLFGLALMGLGGVVAVRGGTLWVVVALLSGGAFVAILAALFVDPEPMKSNLTFIKVTFGDFLPGGRRRGDPAIDPPAPPPPPGGAP